jgi:hypothetical protein
MAAKAWFTVLGAQCLAVCTVPLVVPHRSVPDAGLHQGRSAAFGAGQPGEEAAHLGQVGVPAPAGQRLAAQPGRILGHHGVRVDGLAPASGRLLGPGSHGPPVSRSTVRPPRPDRWSH